MKELTFTQDLTLMFLGALVIILMLLIERRQLERRADGLWRSIEAYRNEKHELVTKLAEAQLDAAEAQSIANILRHRDEATCPCSEVCADRERIAYLTERNNQLVFDALSNNVGKYIKINRN